MGTGAPIGDCLMMQTLFAGVFLLVTAMAAAGDGRRLREVARKPKTGNFTAIGQKKSGQPLLAACPGRKDTVSFLVAPIDFRRRLAYVRVGAH